MMGPMAARRLMGPLATGLATSAAASSLLTGLVSYWTMDEASGTRVDVVGAHNWTQSGGVLGTAGVISNAADCVAASSQYLFQNYNFLSAETSFTWAMWQYFGAVATPQILNTSTVQLGSTAGLVCRFDNAAGNRLVWQVYGSDGTFSFVNIAGTYPDAWRLVVGGYDTSTGKAFACLNGAAKTNASTGLAVDIRTNAAWAHIGRSGGSGYKNTRQDEMGFWTRVLTDPEIVTLYNAGAGKTYPFS